MLISLHEALQYANKAGIAIAAVNVPYFEGLLAAIKVAEHAGTPMILQHAQTHEDLMPLSEIGPVMRLLAARSQNPFVLHIDHATDIDYVCSGIDLGFNSAMFDGSRLQFEENVKKTAEVVRMGRKDGFDVEGELGVVSGSEAGRSGDDITDGAMYTNARQAREFVERTGITALAAAFGTRHGLYKQEPILNYQLIRDLSENAGAALVMHGGSGLSSSQYRLCIANGVRKINYYTYAAAAAAAAVTAASRGDQVPNDALFPSLALRATEAVEANLSSFVAIVNKPPEVLPVAKV